VRLLVVAAALAAALAIGAQASARVDCTAGVVTKGGVTYRTFCGPAKAQVSIGPVHYRFDTGGNCTESGSYYSVNVGTIALPPGKPKYSYFGLTVTAKHAGTFKSPAPAIGWQFPDGKHGGLLFSSVTIAPGMKKGSFSGKVIGTNRPATGTFTC
jgi:hypothetical protein